ncbi:MAG: hypothetical protein M2R45_00703 [Verrucomicrobia subdivision 3 bacterium]|nr:hypothetical protein [Limisphaerales bacterium]MCS1414413.1 hypothetical protein [Limisphaerales bacterium]
MKMTFKGLTRSVFPHEHIVYQQRSDSRTNLEPPLTWDGPLSAKGIILNVELTGNFNVSFEFEEEDLRNWLKLYTKEHPKKSVRLLAELSAEAVIKLNQQAASSVDGRHA